MIELNMRSFSILAFLTLSACATAEKIPQPGQFTSLDCKSYFDSAPGKSSEKKLNIISKLYERGCDQEVIALGNHVREVYRDKVYEVSTETAELFAPEGTFTPYVLESYERSYLSLLLSVSYMRLGQRTASLVELRRSVDEENAVIYNYGHDPVLTLLQAAVWDAFDPMAARSFWVKVSESSRVDQKVRDFAAGRLRQIDKKAAAVDWRIYEIGEFPDLDWESDFISQEKGPYKISARHPFPQTCSGPKALLFPSEPWLDKIAGKHKSDYHPVLYVKSFARMPAALGYSVFGTVGGVLLGVGGCVAAASLKSNAVCDVAIKGGAALMKRSTNFAENTIGPDLRHWKLPSGFLIVAGETNVTPDACIDEGQRWIMKRIK